MLRRRSIRTLMVLAPMSVAIGCSASSEDKRVNFPSDNNLDLESATGQGSGGGEWGTGGSAWGTGGGLGWADHSVA